ncbi:MAG: YtfJ family protein [Desulfobacteraceae bacterium]|nr:YtfJ family protein [Desulfobacteraceae bacterium]
MKKLVILSVFLLLGAGIASAGTIKVGEELPEINIKEKGVMVPEYEIVKDRMVFKEDGRISYREWDSKELSGRIRTIYHLAARDGIDEINEPYIDALIAAKLPEALPDSPYKTITILNMDDALWGTSGIAGMRLEKSQKEFPYACYVADEDGQAIKTWGLKKKESAVIVLDHENRVIFFKEGKLNREEIQTAVALIKSELETD